MKSPRIAFPMQFIFFHKILNHWFSDITMKDFVSYLSVFSLFLSLSSSISLPLSLCLNTSDHRILNYWFSNVIYFSPNIPLSMSNLPYRYLISHYYISRSFYMSSLSLCIYIYVFLSYYLSLPFSHQNYFIYLKLIFVFSTNTLFVTMRPWEIWFSVNFKFFLVWK